MQRIKQKFSVFEQNPELIYLDNAATTQIPTKVIEKLDHYYRNKSNVHRGFYPLAKQATKDLEEARENIAEFISADPEEVTFTSGTTESINNVVRMLETEFSSDDNIVITIVEHHANLVPWQQLSERVGCELRFIGLKDNYELSLESAREKIDKKTKLVSCSYVSNALGVELPVQDLISLANDADAYTVVDSAQVMTNKEIDVGELPIDFLAFSGHKLFGPTGIGVLYGREVLLNRLGPPKYGGEMIKKVEQQSSSWAEIPQKFEAGTPNIAGAIGLGKAVNFIEEQGVKQIASHKKDLTEYLIDKLEKIEAVHVLRPEDKFLSTGIVSLTLTNAHPHDVADILASENICVRAGHHCAMPLMEEVGVSATVRVSISVYNTKTELDQLVEKMRDIIQLFNK